MANEKTPVIESNIITLDDATMALGLRCSNGESLFLNPDTLTDSIRTQALIHGLKQKLVDAAAISRNPDTGKAATPDDKWAAVMEVFNRITGAGGEAPAWNKTREGGAGAGGLLMRALCRLYPAKTPDQIREYLDGKTDAEKTALRKNPKVATMIEEIRAETGKAANVDTDELLNELDD